MIFTLASFWSLMMFLVCPAEGLRSPDLVEFRFHMSRMHFFTREGFERFVCPVESSNGREILVHTALCYVRIS
jgi:hypothetical protein